MRHLLYILIALILTTNVTSCTPDRIEDAAPPATEKFSGRDGMDGIPGRGEVEGDNEGSEGDPG